MSAQHVLDLLAQLWDVCLSDDPGIAEVYTYVAINAEPAYSDLLDTTVPLNGN